MNKNKRVDTIIFDYDGTLHDSSHLYIPAFKKAYRFLVKEGQVEEKQFSDEDITKWLGYTKEEMWGTFQPELPTEYKEKASAMIGAEMTKGILEGRAKLYQHALEVLSSLKKRSYRLIFLSNCSIEYMNTHDKIFGLSQLFDEMICSEQYAFEKSKKEIVQERFGGKNIRLAMIGDRKQDMDVGSLAYVSTVGCAYGYGSPEERRQANMIIEDIKALLLYF